MNFSLDELLVFQGSYERLRFILSIWRMQESEKDKNEWYQLFIEQWQSCDTDFQTAFALDRIFSDSEGEKPSLGEIFKKCAPTKFMEAWQVLPEELIVYRGGYKNNINGWSWSLKKKEAENFTYNERYAQKFGGDRLLATGKVSKHNILFMNEREQEAFSNMVTILSIETVKSITDK